MNESEFKNLHFSMLGKESELDGNFKFSGDTLVNCHVKGTLTILNDGKLILERNAVFEGDIFCQDIEVFGVVKGSIDASGTLSARSSAEISGVIHANHMSIFPGAQINMEAHTSEADNDSEASPV